MKSWERMGTGPGQGNERSHPTSAGRPQLIENYAPYSCDCIYFLCVLHLKNQQIRKISKPHPIPHNAHSH